MKKIFVILLLSVFSLPLLTAQESLFNVGDKVVNVGIGFGSTLYSGSFYSSTVPPVSISFEKGFKDGVLEKGTIGIGGYLGYSSYKWESFGWGWKYTSFIIGARGTLHYPLVDKIDTYAGVLLGYNIRSSKEFGTTVGIEPSSSSGPVFSGFVGGRYYFTDKFAGMAELGYGITWLNIGLGIKL
jgi:hypothetical protein